MFVNKSIGEKEREREEETVAGCDKIWSMMTRFISFKLLIYLRFKGKVWEFD